MNNKSKIKTMIRELILSVEDEDKFKRADKIAGLIRDAIMIHSDNEIYNTGWIDQFFE